MIPPISSSHDEPPITSASVNSALAKGVVPPKPEQVIGTQPRVTLFSFGDAYKSARFLPFKPSATQSRVYSLAIKSAFQ